MSVGVGMVCPEGLGCLQALLKMAKEFMVINVSSPEQTAELPPGPDASRKSLSQSNHSIPGDHVCNLGFRAARRRIFG
jgi:hypothetical protein